MLRGLTCEEADVLAPGKLNALCEHLMNVNLKFHY